MSTPQAGSPGNGPCLQTGTCRWDAVRDLERGSSRTAQGDPTCSDRCACKRKGRQRRRGGDAETPEEKARSRERRPDAAGGPRSAPGRMWLRGHLDSQRPCSRAARQDVSPRLSHWVCVTLRCQDGKTNTAPATVLRMIKQDGAKEELMGRGAERGRYPAAGPGASPGRPCAPPALPPRQAARSPGPDRLPGPAPVRRPRSPHGALRSQGPPWACLCFPLTLWGSQALRKRLARARLTPEGSAGLVAALASWRV